MSRSLRSRAGIAGALLSSTMLLLTACTLAAAPPEEIDLSASVKPLWEVSNDSVSSPVVVDDTVVVYEQRNEAITLVAYSAADGAERWSRESSTGDITQSGRLHPIVVEKTDGSFLVGMVTPPVLNVEENYWQHTMALLDPTTGAAVAESPRTWIRTLEPCEDDLCARVWSNDSEQVEQARLSADGNFIVSPDASARKFDGLPARELAEGLYLTVGEDGAPRDLIVADQEKVLSTSPADKLLGPFQGNARYSLAGAYLSAEEGVYVVSSTRSDTSDPAVERYGADKFVTFGLSRETAKVLWQKEGYLPCLFESFVFCSGDDVAYRQEAASTHFSLEGGDADLVMLDPRTGDEVWSETVKDLGGLGNGVQDESMRSPRGAVVYTAGGRVKVTSTETGKSRAMKKGELVGCFERKTYLAPERSNPSNSVVAFDGAFVTKACGPGVRAADSSDFTRGVVAGGAQRSLRIGEVRSDSDKFYVVQASGKLLAYEL